MLPARFGAFPPLFSAAPHKSLNLGPDGDPVGVNPISACLVPAAFLQLALVCPVLCDDYIRVRLDAYLDGLRRWRFHCCRLCCASESREGNSCGE